MLTQRYLYSCNRVVKLALLGSLSASFSSFAEETLVHRLLKSYEAVQTLSCEIRRVASTEKGKGRFLSRIHYQRPDKINVENIAPLKRRIVSDGSVFYSYIKGDPKGFSRPVSELSTEMTQALRKVPGTAMDHLFHLQAVEELDQDPTEEFPLRKAYFTNGRFVILSCDSLNRLCRIEVFDSPECNQRIAQHDYSRFHEAAPGVWIPLLHKTEATIGPIHTRETVRVSNLEVNIPLAAELFDPARFFEGVDFVDSFDKIYDLP